MMGEIEEYERCMALVDELMNAWSEMRTDEELVVMVLPKKDQKAREEIIAQAREMLLKERWED